MSGFKRTALALACAVAALCSSTAVMADGRLVLYCSAQEELCRTLSQAFEQASGVKVAMTRKASGETYEQVKAEAANPKGDVWWGGTGDPQLQAAEEGLTEVYKSRRLEDLHPWAQKFAEIAGYRSVGVYTGALGYSFNTVELGKRKIAEPRCWFDLTKPEFKGEVQVANPNASGTAYTMLATVVQIMGENRAFEYMKALHKNVNQYIKSGSAPARAVAAGETLVGITFQDDAITQVEKGAPIKVVSPCEGTGYEIGGMSIIKGARNMDNARRWYEWALSPEAQNLAIPSRSHQMPSNRNAMTPPLAPKLSELKLIDYDFQKFGSSAERKRLLARWDRDVGTLLK